MRRVAVLLILGLLLVIATGTELKAEAPSTNGLSGTSPTYGYNAYRPHYSPIFAQRELDYLTYRSGVRGLDYGYGIGYWFGFGPPKQYRLLPPTPQTKAMWGR